MVQVLKKGVKPEACFNRFAGYFHGYKGRAKKTGSYPLGDTIPVISGIP